MKTRKHPEESWIKHYWRPATAWTYTFICLFDFVLAPIITMLFFRETGADYLQWDPLTLKESGFFHLAMGAIIGVSAWTRGNEKLYHIGMRRGSRRREMEDSMAMDNPMAHMDPSMPEPFDPSSGPLE